MSDGGCDETFWRREGLCLEDDVDSLCQYVAACHICVEDARNDGEVEDWAPSSETVASV